MNRLSMARCKGVVMESLPAHRLLEVGGIDNPQLRLATARWFGHLPTGVPGRGLPGSGGKARVVGQDVDQMLVEADPLLFGGFRQGAMQAFGQPQSYPTAEIVRRHVRRGHGAPL